MTCRQPMKLSIAIPRLRRQLESPYVTVVPVVIQWQQTRRLVWRTYRELRIMYHLRPAEARHVVVALATAMAVRPDDNATTEGSS